MSAMHDDTAILLSLSTGRYFSLEAHDRRMWQLLSSGLDEGAVAHTLATGINAPERVDEILSDVRELCDQMANRHLLAPSTGQEGSELWRDTVATRLFQSVAFPARSPRARVPSKARCFASVALIHAGVRLFGLPGVLSWLDSKGSSGCVGVLPHPWLSQMLRNVYTALAFYPFNVACLETSLAILALLRRAGARGQLRLGVDIHPFAAHAWVEYEGSPLNETAETTRRYRLFPALLANSQ